MDMKFKTIHLKQNFLNKQIIFLIKKKFFRTILFKKNNFKFIILILIISLIQSKAIWEQNINIIWLFILVCIIWNVYNYPSKNNQDSEKNNGSNNWNPDSENSNCNTDSTSDDRGGSDGRD